MKQIYSFPYAKKSLHLQKHRQSFWVNKKTNANAKEVWKLWRRWLNHYLQIKHFDRFSIPQSMFFCISSLYPYRNVCGVILILQLRKLKLREVMWIAWGHKASKWRNQGSQPPGILTADSTLFFLHYVAVVLYHTDSVLLEFIAIGCVLWGYSNKFLISSILYIMKFIYVDDISFIRLFLSV